MLILGLLVMYFDAAVVFVTSQTLFKIGSGHTVLQLVLHTLLDTYFIHFIENIS